MLQRHGLSVLTTSLSGLQQSMDGLMVPFKQLKHGASFVAQLGIPSWLCAHAHANIHAVIRTPTADLSILKLSKIKNLSLQISLMSRECAVNSTCVFHGFWFSCRHFCLIYSLQGVINVKEVDSCLAIRGQILAVSIQHLVDCITQFDQLFVLTIYIKVFGRYLLQVR